MEWLFTSLSFTTCWFLYPSYRYLLIFVIPTTTYRVSRAMVDTFYIPH